MSNQLDLVIHETEENLNIDDDLELPVLTTPKKVNFQVVVKYVSPFIRSMIQTYTRSHSVRQCQLCGQISESRRQHHRHVTSHMASLICGCGHQEFDHGRMERHVGESSTLRCRLRRVYQVSNSMVARFNREVLPSQLVGHLTVRRTETDPEGQESGILLHLKPV